MLEVLKPIAASLATTNYVLALCLEQIDDTAARKRVRNGEGPSIAWHVGHMLDHRCKVLGLLGGKKASPYEAKYTAKCASDRNDYPALADLRHEWEQLYAELPPALEVATTESLGEMIERGLHGPGTVLDSTLFLIWHEAYHTGALASICKELGYAGPAELAIAKAAA